jgi:enoyl-CoA hydratase/carnithine racemase
MNDELIQLQVLDGIATMHLNRPEKRNAVNDELRAELIVTLERIGADPTVRALVLTGSGKGFCAGGDVEAMAKRLESPPGEVGFNGWSRQQRTHHAQSLLHALPVPTIAAVNGAAAGLGADLALACDFIVASTAATFAWAYVHRGLIPDGGGLYLLPRRVGLSRAKELIFSGRKVDAEEALRLGIVDRLSSPDQLLSTAQAWAAELRRGSKTALALTKSIINQSFEMSLQQAAAQGSLAQAICYSSSEHHDSVRAFLAQSGKPPGPGKA